MNNRYAKYITPLCVALDVLTISGLLVIFNYYLHEENNTIFVAITDSFKFHYKAIILFVFSWYFIAQKTLVYSLHRGTDYLSILKKVSLQTILVGVVIYAFSGRNDGHILYGSSHTLFFIVILFLLTALYRTIFYVIIRSRRVGGRNSRSVVFVDKNSNTHRLINLFEKSNIYGINPEAIYVDGSDLLPNRPIIKSYDPVELNEFIKKNGITILFFSMSGKLGEKLDEINEIVNKNHLRIIYVPAYGMDLSSGVNMDFFYTTPVLVTKRLPLDLFANKLIKRLFDLALSLFVIVFILSWLFPVLALLIKLDSKGDILYIQKRNGLDGKPFDCYKFRTMRPSEDAGIQSTVKGDKRITKLGHFLRKTSLDEFPQFFNVLKGNMSVVGPRPHMVHQDNHYNRLLPKYCVRYYVKPGITGLSQVSGFRGEIRTDEDMENRITTDLYYVRKWSFLLDIMILLKTIYFALVGDKNAI